MGTSSSSAAEPSGSAGGCSLGASGATYFGSRFGSTSGGNSVWARLAPSPYDSRVSGARSSAVGHAGASEAGVAGLRNGPAARLPATRSSRLIGWSSGTRPPFSDAPPECAEPIASVSSAAAGGGASGSGFDGSGSRFSGGRLGCETSLRFGGGGVFRIVGDTVRTWVSSSTGTTTRAITPPSMSSFSRSRTSMPCRWASRATTYRPIRRVTDTSRSGGSARRSLTSARRSSLIPTPWSVTWIASAFLRVMTARTVILVSGSEK